MSNSFFQAFTYLVLWLRKSWLYSRSCIKNKHKVYILSTARDSHYDVDHSVCGSSIKSLIWSCDGIKKKLKISGINNKLYTCTSQPYKYFLKVLKRKYKPPLQLPILQWILYVIKWCIIISWMYRMFRFW